MAGTLKLIHVLTKRVLKQRATEKERSRDKILQVLLETACVRRSK